jgi:hypothetical protein
MNWIKAKFTLFAMYAALHFKKTPINFQLNALSAAKKMSQEPEFNNI